MQTENVTIIGAGPGGIAAAIQLKRWGLKPLLLEKDHVGGLLVNANLVENYPGFPQGISGLQLVRLFQSQMERIGVTVTCDEVLQLDYDDGFIVKTKEREFVSRFVMVASGTQPIPFDGFEIAEEIADRVFYEVHSLVDLSGKRIAIIGAGDAAFDYSLNMFRKNEVTILNRSVKPKCLPLLWERVAKESRISYYENTSIVGMQSSGDGLILNYKNAQGDWELGVDYVIFAIGRKPQLDFLSPQLRERAAELEGEGLLYFVGDVKNDIFRQTSIAVGDGVRSAMKICQMFQGAS
ncbi:MAG: NAD(P)-binding domain-containing protein [Chloroflexi bacterium]|jgi:thioredoxin reductase (NADPH)|nr:NAD(P)-binding domain-containing protein [Chloroflexota bacterium]